MNLTKLVELVEGLNEQLGSTWQNQNKPILHIHVESSKIYYLYAFDLQIWDSTTNDTYNFEGTLLSMENFITYQLQHFVCMSQAQNKRLHDYFSKQLELNL